MPTKAEISDDNTYLVNQLIKLEAGKSKAKSGGLNMWKLFGSFRDRNVYVDADGLFWACLNKEVFYKNTWIAITQILNASDMSFPSLDAMRHTLDGIEFCTVVNILPLDDENFECDLSDGSHYDSSLTPSYYSMGKIYVRDADIYDEYARVEKEIEKLEQKRQQLLNGCKPIYDHIAEWLKHHPEVRRQS